MSSFSASTGFRLSPKVLLRDVLLFLSGSEGVFSEMGLDGEDSEKARDFAGRLADIVGRCEDDLLSDLTTETLGLELSLLGYSEDEAKGLLALLSEACWRNRLGVIDLTKPADMGNLVISLLDLRG